MLNFFYLVVLDVAYVGVEADAFEGFSGGEVFLVVFPVFDLPEGFFGCTHFEFHDIDVVLGFDDGIDAALIGLYLCLDMNSD